MNCHIVPQCYLKSWKVPTTKSSIYIFDKSKTFTANNKNIENLSDTNFAFEDKYLIDYFNKDYMYKFHTHFFAIMSDLNIIAMYNGKKILDTNDYNNCLDYIDKWIYITADGTVIDDSIVFDMWKERVAKTIENYFAHNIENKWPYVKDYTTSHIMKRSWKVFAKHREILFEFVVVQLLRRFENMQALGLSELIKGLNDMLGTTIFDTAYEESHWLMQLYRYAIQKNNNSVSQSVQNLSDNYQPCFLIATGNAEFITSDNPCYTVKNSDYSFESGIYMPINPKVCLFLCNLSSHTDKNKYYIFDINDQNVKYINKQTRTHALKELAYHSDNICNLFSNNIDKTNWELISNTLYNELYSKT